MVERTSCELPALPTERLKLRQLRREDADSIYEYMSDPDVAMYTSWRAHLTKEETREWVQSLLQQQEIGMAAMWGIQGLGQDKVVGHCGFSHMLRQHGRAELAFALHRSYWGKGLMTEAAQAVVRHAFIRMGLNRVEAVIDPENAATLRVLKRVGMVFEGVMRQGFRVKGVYKDAKFYAVLRHEWKPQ